MKKIVILASGNGSLAQAHIESYTIPMHADRNFWNSELEKLIAALNPDLVVSAGFMRMLAADITQKFRIINSHPALLPAFPGAHAVRDALAAGVTETGTTIHWIDAGMDTGEVIAQEKVEVLPSDDEETLHERIKIVERGLIVATIASLLPTLEPVRG